MHVHMNIADPAAYSQVQPINNGIWMTGLAARHCMAGRQLMQSLMHATKAINNARCTSNTKTNRDESMLTKIDTCMSVTLSP